MRGAGHTPELCLGALVAAWFTAAVVVGGERDHGSRIPVPGISGKLVICGGGRLPEEVFAEMAGDAPDGSNRRTRLVVIPTASADADGEDVEEFASPWRQRGVEHVTVLHTRSRERADAADFVAPLEEATAVWFSGGAQSRVADAYLDTAVQRQLLAVLARGGTIGGTSAGAAIMTEVMIERGNPVAHIARGLGFLPGAIVDQHFAARSRQPRLRGAVEKHPGTFGLGIDEGTALVVEGRRGRVVGAAAVHVCLGRSSTRERREMELPAGAVVDLIALSRAAVARAGEAYPPAEPPAPRVERGTLFIAGGGRLPREVLERFIAAAGGPGALIIVFPAALGHSRNPGAHDERLLRDAGARNVRVLDPRTPEEADEPEVLEALAAAGGIWFSGGRQWRLVDAFFGTRAHELMHAVLERGGAIGGSSAGASIQAGYMVRGHPLGNHVMMAEGYERGLGFLPGAAIDQHFTQRGRFPDMRALKRAYPQLLGIGIDEGTACIVTGVALEVAGAHGVALFDGDTEEHRMLRRGDRYDLTARRVVVRGF